jgi:hypothetical protein
MKRLRGSSEEHFETRLSRLTVSFLLIRIWPHHGGSHACPVGSPTQIHFVFLCKNIRRCLPCVRSRRCLSPADSAARIGNWFRQYRHRRSAHCAARHYAMRGHAIQQFRVCGFFSQAFSFTPACPGPWAKVVLNADFSIQAGRQFDRTAEIWIGGVNVYFGTTSEPSANVARSWHLERDLTDYSALFDNAQNGRVDLGNLVNSTFTSTLFGTAEIQFYPLAHHEDAPRTADLVLPLASDPTGGTAFLSNSSSTLAKTFALPANVERAFIDVVAESQAGDEFWYTCVPNDVANELQSCGGGAFHESQVTIDGTPAGVAHVYPWIYTGGIDPLLWRGAQIRAGLSPLAGDASDV